MTSVSQHAPSTAAALPPLGMVVQELRRCRVHHIANGGRAAEPRCGKALSRNADPVPETCSCSFAATLETRLPSIGSSSHRYHLHFRCLGVTPCNSNISVGVSVAANKVCRLQLVIIILKDLREHK